MSVLNLHMNNRIIDCLKNPRRIGLGLTTRFFKWLPDKMYLELLYFFKLGKKLNLKDPKTFTAKLQWLKLYNRHPEYTKMVDKYEVKNYVSEILGKDYIIPTLGVWEKFSDINFDELPSKFVLKTTHGGGSVGVVICKDKALLNMDNAKKNIEESFKLDIYKMFREWPYKNVPKRIIAEQYMQDDSGELRDYKFYCFNGEPKVMLLASNRFTEHNFTYFDMDFHKLPISSRDGKISSEVLEKPENFDEMKLVAKKLSQGLPHVRVDLYSCNHRIYFGELTFFDGSGYDDMESDEWNLRFGSWLNLPIKYYRN